MILLVDAGSTKTQWCLMTANQQFSLFTTDGINPYFQPQEAIRQCISNQLLPQIGHLLWAGTLNRVFYYGAGCTPEKIPQLEEVLHSLFRKATVEVYSDMVGAARAILGRKEGIACILGTGSNSCYYDGNKPVGSIPALGFILGDEGSGAVLGKRLVADLLKNQLDETLKQRFFERFQTSQADIIEQVYRRPFPNRYLASLSVFCAENIADERIRSLVEMHFKQFVERNILPYYTLYPSLDRLSTPIGMVGSIAYFYREILEQVFSQYSMPVPTIVQSPMDGLRLYHRGDALPTQQ